MQMAMPNDTASILEFEFCWYKDALFDVLINDLLHHFKIELFDQSYVFSKNRIKVSMRIY